VTEERGRDETKPGAGTKSVLSAALAWVRYKAGGGAPALVGAGLAGGAGAGPLGEAQTSDWRPPRFRLRHCSAAVVFVSAATVANSQPRLHLPVPANCSIQCRLYSSAMAVSVAVDLATLGRVGTALADPTRRSVLVQLIDGPGYPGEMAEDVGTTRANLSNHLTCLRECGLVTATAEGRRVRYELADPRLADGLRILAALDLPGSCR
jgi:DNA-binding transcriptional ArsR family regulator